MGFDLPEVPVGTGTSPVTLVVISAPHLAASSAFYSSVFGWQLAPMSGELTGAVAPAGPMLALHSGVPAGFPGIVPYLAAPDVEATLARVVAAGGAIDKPGWKLPAVGTLARFKDTSGTIYGLTDATPAGGIARMAMPFGSNPKPPAGAICSLEMYAGDGAAAARFFGDVFGWGTVATMPQYMAFDPGAGVGGVFQSHTPQTPAVAYIYVSDVDAKLADIEAAGGKRMSEPMRLPGMGCFGYFTDPSQTAVGLIGP